MTRREFLKKQIDRYQGALLSMPPGMESVTIDGQAIRVVDAEGKLRQLRADLMATAIPRRRMEDIYIREC